MADFSSFPRQRVGRKRAPFLSSLDIQLPSPPGDHQCDTAGKSDDAGGIGPATQRLERRRIARFMLRVPRRIVPLGTGCETAAIVQDHIDGGR